MSHPVRTLLVLAVLCLVSAPAAAGVGGGVIWTDLGGGLSGSTTPNLEMSGELTDDEPAIALITDAAPAQRLFLIIGSEAANTPFMGGVLVPSADLLPFTGFPSFGGSLQISITSSGLPSGSEIYVQVWVSDPGGPAGASATNAWQAVLP